MNIFFLNRFECSKWNQGIYFLEIKWSTVLYYVDLLLYCLIQKHFVDKRQNKLRLNLFEPQNNMIVILTRFCLVWRSKMTYWLCYCWITRGNHVDWGGIL